MMHNFTAGVELRLLQQTYVSSCQEKSVDDLTPLQSGCRQKNKKHWPTKTKIKKLISDYQSRFLVMSPISFLYCPVCLTILPFLNVNIHRLLCWSASFHSLGCYCSMGTWWCWWGYWVEAHGLANKMKIFSLHVWVRRILWSLKEIRKTTWWINRPDISKNKLSPPQSSKTYCT